ncbi:flagellar biosynthetic protein FliO [Corallococcus sp. Z5C101001]|uniref:flagellar biosynthetic protein FliO n=1 Tax=Corallococcus sp. Z5C101001 TaxID=2596829 RepID=UPI00117F4DA7|nr:flagellar biosynthetic protein FliO [Corallococcus sp. Z5C101001]TSC32149.1 flagellar biosynthetic protein FliO [Corallococcus sp. Z5C101001]
MSTPVHMLVASFSPRGRLLFAAALLVGLAALAPLGGLSWVGTSRLLVGSMALAGLGWVVLRKGGAGGEAAAFPPEPLSIVSRVGLSQRCGLALVQVEGRRYLVAYGDTFAEIHEARGMAILPGATLRPTVKPRLDLEPTVLFTRARQARPPCGASRKRGGG